MPLLVFLSGSFQFSQWQNLDYALDNIIFLDARCKLENFVAEQMTLDKQFFDVVSECVHVCICVITIIIPQKYV